VPRGRKPNDLTGLRSGRLTNGRPARGDDGCLRIDSLTRAAPQAWPGRHADLNNDVHYEKSNLRWATASQQNANTRRSRPYTEWVNGVERELEIEE
jgi:hypothetical protein